MCELKVCEFCGRPIPEKRYRNRPRVRFCSDRCRVDAADRRRRSLGPWSHLPTPTRGAISELRTAADLLERGFSVFRSESPSCPCDLVLLDSGEAFTLYAIEVKSATLLPGGGLAKPTVSQPVDLLAIVLPDRVVYRPLTDRARTLHLPNA